LFGFSYDQTGNDPHAILRRWDVDWDVDGRDLEEKPSAAFAARVRARPLARIMNFADYDNDGRATEFMLQIGTEPCGKKESIVVGISRDNPHLHAFASVRNPGKPLLLMDWQWNALNGSKDVVEVGDLTCGDHGSDVNRDLVLRAENGRISATRRTYECTGQATRGGLSKEEDF
jgi:hypothetical protein